MCLLQVSCLGNWRRLFPYGLYLLLRKQSFYFCINKSTFWMRRSSYDTGVHCISRDRLQVSYLKSRTNCAVSPPWGSCHGRECPHFLLLSRNLLYTCHSLPVLQRAPLAALPCPLLAAILSQITESHRASVVWCRVDQMGRRSSTDIERGRYGDACASGLCLA